MNLNVAIEGCCHGELDRIYETIHEAEIKSGKKVDLLLICGDMECLRCTNDLNSIAVPNKYKRMNSFHEYFIGEKVAPVMTIFIGGNHEASNFMQDLYYGGYVAKNIYFLGFAGSVYYRGLRISGISGIYHKSHYMRGHYEAPPFNPDSLRSIYHTRHVEILRLKTLTTSCRNDNMDIFLSHDWPSGIWNFGNCQQLLRRKPFFKDEISTGELGSPALESLLHELRPKFWFAAHLHVKFAAIVPHHCGATTRFLSLDKVLPRRQFLQIITIPSSATSNQEYEDPRIHFDLNWLAILRNTQLYEMTSFDLRTMQQVITAPTIDEVQNVRDLLLRANYSAAEYDANRITVPEFTTVTEEELQHINERNIRGNPQTDRLISAIGMTHTWTIPYRLSSSSNISMNEKVPDSSNLDTIDPNELEV